MEWLPYVHDAIEYIEANLLSVEGPKEVAEHLHMSEVLLQKGFHVLTGYSVAEYIRNRRLYEAAVEITSTDERMVDISLKYGYEGQDSFTKAFTRFHGINPAALRKNGEGYRHFLPVKVELVVHGGTDSKVKTVRKYPLKLIGMSSEVDLENGTEDIRLLWQKLHETYYSGKEDDESKMRIAKAIEENGIGEFGVLSRQNKGNAFYMIAGRYAGGDIPEGMQVISIPGGEWAVFDMSGPVQPGTLCFDTDIRSKWIEEISDYEPINEISIEWYESIDADKNKDNYKSALWIPVKDKKKSKDKHSFLKRAIKSPVFIILAVIMLVGICIAVGIGFGSQNIRPESDTRLFAEETGEYQMYSTLIVDGIEYYISKGTLEEEPGRLIGVFEAFGVLPGDNNQGFEPTDAPPAPGSFIPESSIGFNVPGVSNEIKVKKDVEVYEINGVDSAFAVAVRFPEAGLFIVYYNPEFEADNFQNYRESLNLKEYMEFGSCTVFTREGDDCRINNPNKELELFWNILNNKEIPCFKVDDIPFEFINEKIVDYIGEKHTEPYSSFQKISVDADSVRKFCEDKELGGKQIGITINYKLLYETNLRMYLFSGGFMFCNIGGTDRCFFVGEEAVDRFVCEILKN